MPSLVCEYDRTNREDILRHAKNLEGHTVGEVYELEVVGTNRADVLRKYAERIMTGYTDEDGRIHKANKGAIGNLVQEVYFDIPVNGIPDADIEDSHVEIKVSPLKRIRNGFSVKERLILGMIGRYNTLPDNFTESHIYEKCRATMLIYYIDMTDSGDTPFQFPFHKAAYFTFPASDMAIIQRDYEYIRDHVNSGTYDEMSERDCLYLSPNTKNQGRSYSFKVSYMTHLFRDYIELDIPIDGVDEIMAEQAYQEYDAIITDVTELQERSFYDIVLSRFAPYIGMSLMEIREQIMDAEEFADWCGHLQRLSRPGDRITSTGAFAIDKATLARTAYMMLGINGNHAEEFVNADIYVKTIKIGPNGKIKEKISFPAFEFSDIVNEEWENSACYENIFNRKFLWSVFKQEGDDYIFKGAKFWSVPEDDERIIRQGWEDIKEIIIDGVDFVYHNHRVLNSFPDSHNTNPAREEYRLCPSQKPYNPIISIRPHAAQVYYDLNSIGYHETQNGRSNGSELPNGDIMTKQCFWFNNDYILSQLQDIME